MTGSNDSLITEQSTRLVGQIIDDLDRLKEEFMSVNMAEILAKNPELGPIIMLALNNIKSGFYTTFVFLEGMKKAIEEDSD